MLKICMYFLIYFPIEPRIALAIRVARRDLRVSMKLHQSLRTFFCVSLICLLGGISRADEGVAQLVEVELSQDNLASYKERRENHGAYVGFAYEAMDLKNFVSTLDSQSYRSLFGKKGVPLVRLMVDYKYNFMLGSFALGLDYGMGRLTDRLSGAERSLEISKYGVGIKFTADMIVDEPYAAPYIGINLWQMGISETSPTDSFSATTQMGLNYTVGLLLQLDWIDLESAKYATFKWGLENTFLDLYATQYAQTSAVDDPNTETEWLYGGGLRLEF